jgi:hypothetical protein
MLSSNR